MKTLLKIFFTCAVCLVAELTEAQQQNTPTRQVRFYPVRAASDTAATVGNSGRMWYDFISNKFRGNVGGTNFTFGSGGGPSYIFGNGLILAAADSVVIDSTKVGLKSDLSGWLTGTLTGEANIVGTGTQRIRFGANSFIPTYAQSINTFRVYAGGSNPSIYLVSGDVGGGTTDYSSLNLSTGNYTLYNSNGASTNYSHVQGISGNIFISRYVNSVKQQSLEFTGSNVVFRLGTSDATGDTYYRNSSGYFTRLAKGAEGTLLRAGSSVPAYSTFTIPDTISALSTFVSNSANVLTAITPAAGQSIRVNAGGTAWEAYTPGTGGGFTNGAANNELIKSDGTNGVASGIFAEALPGSLTTTFGLTGATAGQFRDFIAAGSEANIHFRFIPKGSGNIILNSATQITQGAPVSSVTQSGYTIELRANDRIIRFSKTSTGNKQTLIQGGAGISSEHDADSLVIAAGDAYHVSGDGNGGNLILKGGAGNGTGVDGNVYTKYKGYNINLALFEPVQETGTSFTFDYSHLSKLVVTTSATAVSATVPALQVGYITKVRQYGAGNITLTAGTNVVLQGKTSTTGPGDSIVIHAFITDNGDTIYACE
jgi:hypothetical protein